MADEATTANVVDGVRTFTDAARILGTDYRTISALVRAKRIRPKRTGLSGRASHTGLDDRDLRILKESLSPVPSGEH